MITVNDILKKIKYVSHVGQADARVTEPVQATSAEITATNIMWVSDKNKALIEKIPAGIVICSVNIDQSTFKKECTYIIVENPRSTFQQILELFFVEEPTPYISNTAVVDPSAVIGKNVTIGHGVVIEAGCVIGDSSEIGHNTVLKRKTIVGKHVKIGSNCTIGGVGFGYEKDESGEYKFIPHLGNVVIDDRVDVGNNTAIDRAVMGKTWIGENCKIDNLVHIAHGVQLGRNSLVIANAMVAGSVVVGENVWIAPSSSILNNKSVADNAVIGMGAVVLKNVNAGDVIVGNPGKVLPK